MNQKKDSNGWLIAVVIAIVVLWLGIVVMSGLFGYMLFQEGAGTRLVSGLMEEEFAEEKPEDEFVFGHSDSDKDEEKKEEAATEEAFEDYLEDNSNENHISGGIQGAYDEDDYSYVDEKTGKKYYTELKDASRSDLNYSVSWQEYTYKTDYKNVIIKSTYPKLAGENIPNLDYINDYIFDEVEFWVQSFEEYVEKGYFAEDDEFYFLADAYVTYMDEEKISIVYSEYGEADGSTMYYLYSVNVDVQNGVILDNASIVNMDDEFAVEFRERNREQNSASGYIDEMSDQEIEEYLNSPTMGVVFYTPLGLEVGVNLDYGWYTVTFQDYEKYLKKL